MNLDDLRQALYAADPAALLVTPRILRRVIQAEFQVPYLLVRVPHERCYFVERQSLFRHAEQDELDLEQDRLLPETVILLARPAVEALQEREREAVLQKYWRLLFHVRVHMALHARLAEGLLTPVDVQARVAAIGQTGFEEIRTVLRQENTLLPPEDDLHTYIEFAAVYLELRYFRSNLRGTYFPALRDFTAIDRLLAADVDADALFARTRLAGAPDPVVHTDTSADDSHDYYWKLMRQADRAGKAGETLRSAVLHTRAARVAPASLAQHTRASALVDLERLTARLQDALKFSDADAAAWLLVLPALLDKADQGNLPVEAKMLKDLENVCVENERKLFALDVVEWVVSAGKRPIKRPLHSLKLVRVTRHLRACAQRLTLARVSDDDRGRLARLLQAAQRQGEERLRDHFRPILHDAFQDVGLEAHNAPERVALDKMIEELLDRIAEYGFFTFSDLRDTISRNQLKLPDLADPHAFWWGDPLLRLDRRLASPMDGVYRRGEFYMRWLESISALASGTTLGRSLSRNFILPFGGAYALLRSVQILVNEYLNGAFQLHPLVTFFPLGLFFLALTHSPKLRHGLVEAGRRTYGGLRFAFYEVPVRLWQMPLVRTILSSWPVLLFYWYFLKPLIVCSAIWIWWRWSAGPDPDGEGSFLPNLPVALVTFVLTSLLLNSRFGYAVSEGGAEMLLLAYTWLRFDALQGLFRLITRFFRQVTQMVEYVLYVVDERLRFRGGEGRINMAARGVMAAIWFPIGYLARFYYTLLLEPTLNPVKLPLSSLAFKFFVLMPWYLALLNPNTLSADVARHTGSELVAILVAWVIVLPTVWLLPGIVAFFLWEMQENWRLFRANRRAKVGPVAVGNHGEPMLQLLRPGLHSGTIPRLYRQLRHAELAAYHDGDWRPARTYRLNLEEVAQSVRVFIERELLALITPTADWPRGPLSVGPIELSCNRIRIELRHPERTKESLWLTFEERAGRLIGALQGPGWLTDLTAEQARVTAAGLAWLFKIVGVDLLGGRLDALMAPDLSGPAVALGRPPLLLLDHSNRRMPVPADGNGVANASMPDTSRLLAFQVPLTWEQWVEYWDGHSVRANGQAAPSGADRA